MSAAGFWDRLYAEGQDGWELGGPAPALEHWLASGGKFEAEPGTSVRGAGASGLSAAWGSAGAISGPPHMENAHVAVPGAGRGHDARLLARRAYRVTAFDFADAAVTEARRLGAADGVHVAVERRDVFTLDHDHAGAFDGVWEYTCFCAIDPARRMEYARVLHAILRPGGLLLACFYPLREGTDGPPFPVSRDDIDRALAGRFRVLRAGPPGRSVERRRELEWLVEARRL
ncbi:MAG TPA: methyltransferase domain-containing protein [Candidatus Deferrimicrobiaceae bacterium]|nr:methyltransferase domain-containing protein [Candidatus Deferrimicrobiaceae bacterium]